MEELFVFTDGEEYVIAKDEADARLVYEATGAIIPGDVTFGQWARERGRGYFAGSL